MGLIKDKKTGRNISISAVNGYTAEKVRKAEQYIKEIGGQTRTFPLQRIVEMYNDIKGTHEKAPNCRCQFSKYYMGIQNYITYGRLTLQANGIDVDSVEEKEEEPKVEEPVVVEETKVEEAPKKMTAKERMEKARLAKKKKNEDKD